MKSHRFFAAAISMALTGALLQAGELQDAFQKQADHPSKEYKDFQDKSDNHRVTEIGLERTPCFGMCPVYTVIFKADGTFRYHGEAHVPRIGDYTGKIDQYQFERLAQFIKDDGFADLKDSYSAGITDMSTVYTMAVIDGKQKIVEDYAHAGPAKLWVVEELIDKIMDDATWDQPFRDTGAATQPAR